jgi:hypothetical protein
VCQRWVGYVASRRSHGPFLKEFVMAALFSGLLANILPLLLNVLVSLFLGGATTPAV